MLLKKILHRALGTENYLYLTSRAFFMLYRSGLLRKYRQFDCHYFVRELVSQGDTVIDIGANLGYYSVIFSRLAGKTGTVHCVEPIGLYRKVLEKNTRKLKNVTVYPYALGEAEGSEVKMGIPAGEKHYRHGLMRIIEGDDVSKFEHISVAEMRKPEKLFENLEKCDYIKCDVEGYEMHILPGLLPLFQKFRPVLQVETSLINKNKMVELLTEISYRAYYVTNGKLLDITNPDELGNGDVFFIPSETVR